MNDFLIFSKKPKLRIKQSIKEITADNGHFIFYYNAVVKKIQKVKGGYKVILEQRYDK